MTKEGLIYKICDETYHMRKIIESCETIEQIENINKWACSLVDKWYNLKSDFGLSYGVDVMRYIDSAADDMTVFIRKSKEKIQGV